MEFNEFKKMLRRKGFSIAAMNEYPDEADNDIKYLYCIVNQDDGNKCLKAEGLHDDVFKNIMERLGDYEDI